MNIFLKDFVKNCWFQLLFLALAIIAVHCGWWDAAGGLALGTVLPSRDKLFRPAELNPGSATLLGTTFEKELPGNLPYEGIDIAVDFTLGGTPPSAFVAGDGPLRIVKRVEIESRSPIAPGVIVNASGIGLLELASHTMFNLDPATLAVVSEVIAGMDASQKHRIVYHVPFIPPQITGKLRSRFLLDCHNHKAPPKIKIDFSAAAEMYGAGSISAVSAEIHLRRRHMDESINAMILESGGYIPTDLLEQVHTRGVGVSGEQQFKLFVKGKMLGILMRMYLGSASANTLTRGDISEVLTLGSESLWKLDIGGTPVYEFTMKGQKAKNDRSRPLNSAVLSSSPSHGAALASNTHYQDPASVYIDCLTDEGGQVEELGGVLDIDRESAQNNECNIIGPVSSKAGTGHTVNLIGQRILRSDISRWQAIK